MFKVNHMINKHPFQRGGGGAVAVAVIIPLHVVRLCCGNKVMCWYRMGCVI